MTDDLTAVDLAAAVLLHTPPCSSTDPDLWFPDSRVTVDAGVVAICRSCPIRRPCLAYALWHVEDGVWGGLTPRERERVQEAAGIQPRPPVHVEPRSVGGAA